MAGARSSPGLGFLPMPVTIMFMSLVVVRRLIPTIGIRPFLTVGPILAIVAMVLFSTARRDKHLLAVPGMHPAARPRHGLQLRAADHDRGQRRRPARDRPRLGAAQHRPAGRRCHRSRSLRHHLRPRRSRPTSEIGPLAATTAGQTTIFVAGQQQAFEAAIVVTALALVASLALIRVQKVAPPTADEGHEQEGQQARVQVVGQK